MNMKKFYYAISVLFFVGSLTIKATPSYTTPLPGQGDQNYYAPLPPTSDSNENKFVLYVSDGILYIKYNKPQELLNSEAVVYNLLGQEITRKKLENTNLNQISIPQQNTCYIIKISYSGKVHTQKVMVSGQ